MNNQHIYRIINLFERFIILLLVVIMGGVVLFTTLELALYIGKEFFISISKTQIILDKTELTKIFGLFFNVLIGLELFETVKLYLRDDVLNAEVIILVVLIAVSRKLIITDFDNASYEIIAAIAAIILALAVGYYLIRKGQRKFCKPIKPSSEIQKS